MGYSTVRIGGAVTMAGRLAALRPSAAAGAAADLETTLPRLLDQVCAESGVYDAKVAERAIRQADGDIARAVSLIRAWASTLPRLGVLRVRADDARLLRRITPAFGEPPGGQWLGATYDYAQRLLGFDDPVELAEELAPDGLSGLDERRAGADADCPDTLPATLDVLADAGLVSCEPPATPYDHTREADGKGGGRGGFQQRMSRAETGALTALAYAAIRGYGTRSDPTLVELRSLGVPIRVRCPAGDDVIVGEVPVTTAVVVLYRMHDGEPDPRLCVGVGATFGGLERRAVSAAVLDANCARAAAAGAPPESLVDDTEMLSVILDGQEAAGFVEHLKLAHHVTFASELERICAARAAAGEPDGGGDAS